MTTIFDDIRAAAALVAAKSGQVRINRDLIPAYALALPEDRLHTPSMDPTTHYLGHGEDTLAFILVLDTINFGSGYFPSLRKRPGMSGYFTMAAGLTDRFRTMGPPAPADLLGLTAEACADWFGQEKNNPDAMALMALFAEALRHLGQFVLRDFGGRFVNLVEAADHRAVRLVELVRRMPFFEDVATLNGRAVPFFKRAQLMAADLALAFGGVGWGRFDDLDQLTIFADNLVPHVLRVDGLLAYDAGLAQRIDLGELIPAGSPEEIELRALALHAVELMAAARAAAGCPTTAMHLDYLLWNRGQGPAYKAIPRHRTRTVYY